MKIRYTSTKLRSTASLLFAAAVITTTTRTCKAFVPALSVRPTPEASQPRVTSVSAAGLDMRWRSRNRVSGPSMAVSHAAAEEIANVDDVPTLKDAVSIENLEALDLRVGRIVLADAVPDPDHGNKASRKYLSLVVDLGNEKRRVVSAIRSIVDVEDAIGKAVLMAANVEEETILGLPSRGRILSASNFSKEPMPRTLRTVLLGGGGVPPGSAISGL